MYLMQMEYISLSFKKHAFPERVLTLVLVFQLLQYLIATNSIDIIVADFNYDNVTR